MSEQENKTIENVETAKDMPNETGGQRGIVTINDIVYYVDSLSQDAEAYIQNIQMIEEEVQRIQLQQNIAYLAKDTLVNKLEDLADTFEKVPVVGEEDV